MKKALYTLLLTIVVIVVVLLGGPGNLRAKEYREVQGVVSTVYNYGNNDLIVKIGDGKVSYCLCKILDQTHLLGEYKHQLLGKKVVIQYADLWTPLDPGCTKQVCKLQVEKTLLYSAVP